MLEVTLKTALQAGLAPNVTVVQANVTSVNGIDVSGLTRRRLTQGEVLWQAVMEAVTTVVTVINNGNLVSATVNGEEQPLNNLAGSSNSAVVDAVAGQDSIGDMFLASVTQAMDNAITPSATGENLFMTTFQATVAEASAATGDSTLTATLTELIENLAVTSVATDQTQDVGLVQQLDISPAVTEIIETLTALNQWYPDWSTSSSTKCLNDGNAPHYMRDMYFENSRASCCKKYFSWDYISCAGNSLGLPTGFYPDWTSNEDKCVNATDTMPDYMRNNPKLWLSDTVESCCESYYNWEFNNCVSKSGGNVVLSYTGKYYVNHQKLICQQDCPQGENGGRCGGAVKSWNVLYDTAKKCCEKKLGWIAISTCEAKSNLATTTGSLHWYVDWVNEKCVKDCNDSSDVNCGGLIKGWEKLYETATKCCAMLNWVPRADCTL